MLGPGDALPSRPQRVLVAGTSGAGKTTVARAVAEALGCPHVELDALHHGPGWTPRAEFEDDVRRFAASDAWASEWQYAAVRELLLARADLLVWLDLPRTRERVLAALAARPELPVVRLSSRTEVAGWVAGLSRGTASASAP